MSLRSNTAAGQTSGTTVTVANSDDFGESAFQYVNGPATYDATHTHVGSMAFKFTPTSGANAVVQYGGSTGNLVSGNTAADAWCYFTANPTAEFTLIGAYNTGATRRININLTNTGKVKARDEGVTYLWTSTASIPLNAWFRVRVYSENNGAGASFFKVTFTDAGGTVLDSFSTSAATRTEPVAGWAYGKNGTDTTATEFWMSELKAETAATGYVGEAPPVAAAVKTMSCQINATTSTGDIDTYAITHISGPSVTGDATVVTPGIWDVPIPDSVNDVWRVTTTGPSGTDTIDVTVPYVGSGVPVVMLYCTAPGVFV